MTTTSDTHAKLVTNHRAELYESGLTDESIESAGIYTAKDGDIKELLGWKPKECHWGMGMVFPFRFPDQPETVYCRVKLDYPRMGKDDKPVKYESPVKMPNRGYFPPGFHDVIGDEPELRIVSDDSSHIVITEGEKKALAVMQTGTPCIGLVGVWGWAVRRPRTDTGKAYGPRTLIPDLAAIKWNGRSIVIMFDSDIEDKEGVQLAESRLAETLQERGARVRVARIPTGDDGKVGIDDFLLAQGEDAPDKLRKLIKEAKAPEAPPVPAPMDWAKKFVGDHFTGKQGVKLRWWRDEFYRWVEKQHHYSALPKSELQAVVFEWLDKRRARTKPRDAADVVGALAATCRVPFAVEPPCYLGEGGTMNADNTVSFSNGLLDISKIGGDLTLYEHTTRWFSLTSLPYPYQPEALCPRWDAFLVDVLSNDPERIGLLRQWCGLMLTADTSFQKLLMMIGPKRSGKGTILRILQHIVGQDACVAPTLSSLAGEFGLWQLIGKTVAVFPDAHLSFRVDGVRVLEVIKSIVGEDSVSINRKNLPYLTNCRLGVRFIITVNELPRFNDASDALGARLLILPFENTYAGCEDRSLEGKLKAEASGILNWSLRGLNQLRTDGRFHVPEASKAIQATYRRLTAPITGFIEDRCELSPAATVLCSDLYAAYRNWCEKSGHIAAADSTFGGQLRAAETSIERRRPHAKGSRPWCYHGIELIAGGAQE